jgi:hypothetical protein
MFDKLTNRELEALRVRILRAYTDAEKWSDFAVELSDIYDDVENRMMTVGFIF